MVIDTYGQGATGATPYDPCVFDNAATPYSKDNSTSAEKEDTDIFTFKHARIGGTLTGAVSEISVDNDAAPVEWYTLQGVRVDNPGAGLYIRRCGDKDTKHLIK